MPCGRTSAAGSTDLVFSVGGAQTAGPVAAEVRHALTVWEPRLDLLDVAVERRRLLGTTLADPDRVPRPRDEQRVQPRLSVLPRAGRRDDRAARRPARHRGARPRHEGGAPRALGLAEPPAGEDRRVPGEGLVEIFARLAEIVVDRLNAVPDKNLLAFLALVGVILSRPSQRGCRSRSTLRRGDARQRARGDARPRPCLRRRDDAPVYETDAELVLTATLPVRGVCSRAGA